MGLDTSHGCWHGAYSAFMRWREMITKVAGLPPLGLMEGFYDPKGAEYRDPLYWAAKGLGREDSWIKDMREQLPIRWDCLKPSPLFILLHHSDCEGEIETKDCGPIADALESLIPLLPSGDSGGHIGDYRDKTQTFVDGLRLAAAAGENVDFH